MRSNQHGEIYVNIRGLYTKSDKSKVPYLSDLAEEANDPFICIKESHLNPEILDAEVSIPGYHVSEVTGLEDLMGGVAPYVRKDFVVKSELKDSNSYCNSLILYIHQLNLVLANINRPPNCPKIMF